MGGPRGGDGQTDGQTNGRTDGRKISPFYRTSSPTGAAAQKDGPGPVMVSSTLCSAVHILGTQNVYSRERVSLTITGPGPSFAPCPLFLAPCALLIVLAPWSKKHVNGLWPSKYLLVKSSRFLKGECKTICCCIRGAMRCFVHVYVSGCVRVAVYARMHSIA